MISQLDFLSTNEVSILPYICRSSDFLFLCNFYSCLSPFLYLVIYLKKSLCRNALYILGTNPLANEDIVNFFFTSLCLVFPLSIYLLIIECLFLLSSDLLSFSFLRGFYFLIF